MDIVQLEEIQRSVETQSPDRTITIEPNLRVVDVEFPFRTVDVTMTYTLEEFYFITPFELVEELKEGNI